MSEVRLIDADALMERFAEMQKVKPDKDGREYACNFINMGGEPSAEWFTVEDAVENAPTVDAVPVVRCGECKHRIGTIYARDGMTILKVCELKHGTNSIDFYCKDGERGESCRTSRF